MRISAPEPLPTSPSRLSLRPSAIRPPPSRQGKLTAPARCSDGAPGRAYAAAEPRLRRPAQNRAPKPSATMPSVPGDRSARTPPAPCRASRATRRRPAESPPGSAAAARPPQTSSTKPRRRSGRPKNPATAPAPGQSCRNAPAAPARAASPPRPRRSTGPPSPHQGAPGHGAANAASSSTSCSRSSKGASRPG